MGEKVGGSIHSAVQRVESEREEGHLVFAVFKQILLRLVFTLLPLPNLSDIEKY